MNLGTRAVEHKDCNWGMQMIDACNFVLCVATLSVALPGVAVQIEINSIKDCIFLYFIRKVHLHLHLYNMHHI